MNPSSRFGAVKALIDGSRPCAAPDHRDLRRPVTTSETSMRAFPTNNPTASPNTVSLHKRWQSGSERGQATVEYALVVLAAAAVALLVIAWTARTGKVGELLDRVFDQVVARAG